MKEKETTEKIPLCESSTYYLENKTNWYHPVLVGPSTLGRLSSKHTTLNKVLQITNKLKEDDYSAYLNSYYKKGIQNIGESWVYSDILTALFASAQILKPKTYLEIGVRRGRSMAMIASQCPDCHIIGFDMWIKNYAGMENPGIDFVKEEMRKIGYNGTLELITGNSHDTVNQFFLNNPNVYLDLLTIDGDHTYEGARKDFEDTLPRLKVGGAVVFDDIAHPQHPYLLDLWNSSIRENPAFSSWEFSELGYGVGIAIRKEN